MLADQTTPRSGRDSFIDSVIPRIDLMGIDIAAQQRASTTSLRITDRLRFCCATTTCGVKRRQALTFTRTDGLMLKTLARADAVRRARRGKRHGVGRVYVVMRAGSRGRFAPSTGWAAAPGLKPGRGARRTKRNLASGAWHPCSSACE
eukprot:1155725-Pleurochrysis_carterae.AAC.1